MTIPILTSCLRQARPQLRQAGDLSDGSSFIRDLFKAKKEQTFTRGSVHCKLEARFFWSSSFCNSEQSFRFTVRSRQSNNYLPFDHDSSTLWSWSFCQDFRQVLQSRDSFYCVLQAIFGHFFNLTAVFIAGTDRGNAGRAPTTLFTCPTFFLSSLPSQHHSFRHC